MSRPLAAVIVLSSAVGVGKSGSKGPFEAIPSLKRSELYEMYPITRNDKLETYIVKCSLITIVVNKHLKELQDVRCLRWGVFLGCSIETHYHMARMRVVLRQRVHGIHEVRTSAACSYIAHISWLWIVTGSCILPCLFRSVRVVCSCLPVPKCDKVKTVPFGCDDQIVSYSIQSMAPPILLELLEQIVILEWELNIPVNTWRVSHVVTPSHW